MISVFSNMTHLRDEDAVCDQVNEDGRHVLSEGIQVFKKSHHDDHRGPRQLSASVPRLGV